jgi:hypothetical protein
MAIDDLGKFLSKLGRLLNAVTETGKGLKQIFEGVIKEFTGLPQGVWYGLLNSSVFIQYIWEFAITNFMCGMKLMNNAFSCAIYYILEIIGQMLYLLPRIFFWILDKITGKKKIGSMIERTIWRALEWVDRLTITYLKFHIIHYSKSVREMCYNCKRLKPTVFVDQAVGFVDDLADPILDLSVGGIKQMVNGLGRIVNALMI